MTEQAVATIERTNGTEIEIKSTLDTAHIGALAKRISQAALNIGIVEKRGRNTHFNYDYATAEDVKAAARGALAEQGVTIIPIMRKVEQRQNKNMLVTRVHFDYIVSCEDGYMVVPWVADSQDTGDKGIAKCATIGLKYFLINLLQIPTGLEDDPDADGTPRAEPPAERARQRAKRQPRRKSNGKIQRPMPPLMVRKALQKKADGRGDSGIPATEKQVPFLARKFEEAFGGEEDSAKKYHSCLDWLWGVDSAKSLTQAQAAVTLDWLLSSDGPDETGDIALHEAAPEEARRVLRQALKDAGQMDMFDAENAEEGTE